MDLHNIKEVHTWHYDTTCVSSAPLIEFPFESLEYGDGFIYTGMPFKSVSFTNLKQYSYMGYTFIVSGNELEELRLPSLVECPDIGYGCILDAGSVPKLRILDMPLLRKMNKSHSFGRVVKNNLNKLEILRLGSITFNISEYFDSGYGSLIDFCIGCDNLGGVNINIDIRLWKPSIPLYTDSSSLVYDGEEFLNNKEKFLYNLKNHTLGGLRNRTGSSRLTITLSNIIGNALSDEEKLQLTEIATTKNWSIAYG